jgi:hypothetical protein
MPCAGFRANLLSSNRINCQAVQTICSWTGTNSALATQGRELTAFLRRHSLQTEKSLKPYSTHILPGHAIPCGWLLGWLAMGRRSSL